MDTISGFEDRMAELGTSLSPDARNLVKTVLQQELQNRFSDRSQLPASFATKALKVAKGNSIRGGDQ